jgi:transcriptional regulator with XRE-family HTH domain
MTQKELADRAGLTQGAISRIERGALVDVRSWTLGALAKVLGVSPDYLAGSAWRLAPKDTASMDTQLAEYVGMLALLPTDAANRVYGFISSELQRHREKEREKKQREEEEEADAHIARDTPSAPFGPDVKR